MAVISREEFNNFYKEKIEPLLTELESERIKLNKKIKPFEIACIVFVFLIVLSLGFILFSNFEYAKVILCISFVVLAPCGLYCSSIKKKFMTKLKSQVTSKVLALYGNLYFSGKKNLILEEEVRESGLFPRFSWKNDDDIIVGIHKGCNFVISESEMQHTEGSGKSRRTVTDFKGLIVKIQMKKPFSCRTAVGNDIAKRRGYERVELESVSFMKGRKIYSTDQIEARYILTPSFMEKIEGLQQLYNTSSLVSVAFMLGYVYFYIPTDKDFFELPFKETLLNPSNYYDIYNELDYILSVIDYLNLDRNLGL